MVPLDQVEHYPCHEEDQKQKRKKLGWIKLKSLQSTVKKFMNAKQLAQSDRDDEREKQRKRNLKKLMRYAKQQRHSKDKEKRWLVTLPKIQWERYKDHDKKQLNKRQQQVGFATNARVCCGRLASGESS
eukprot:2816122-Pyramimonas_sp.AAC.1